MSGQSAYTPDRQSTTLVWSEEWAERSRYAWVLQLQKQGTYIIQPGTLFAKLRSALACSRGFRSRSNQIKYLTILILSNGNSRHDLICSSITVSTAASTTNRFFSVFWACLFRAASLTARLVVLWKDSSTVWPFLLSRSAEIESWYSSVRLQMWDLIRYLPYVFFSKHQDSYNT